jgi:hypothetical protein
VGRFLDIASRIRDYEINELNEISPSTFGQEAGGGIPSGGTSDQGASAEDKRHKAVLDMRERHPSTTHAFICDDESDSDYVIVTVGIRGMGTCELRIPRENYDGLAVLKLVEEHTGGCCTSAADSMMVSSDAWWRLSSIRYRNPIADVEIICMTAI